MRTRGSLALLAGGLAIGLMTGPAMAHWDEDGWRRPHGHHWAAWGAIEAPPPVYAPPSVYYYPPPPPAYYYPSPRVYYEPAPPPTVYVPPVVSAPPQYAPPVVSSFSIGFGFGR